MNRIKLCYVPDKKYGKKWELFPKEKEVPEAERVIRGNSKILQLYKYFLETSALSIKDTEILQRAVYVLEDTL